MYNLNQGLIADLMICQKSFVDHWVDWHPRHTADQKTGGSKMFAAGKKRPFSTWPASQEKTEKGSEKV